MKKDREQSQRTVMFDESDVIGAKIDKLTCMIENSLLSTSSPNHLKLESIRVRDNLWLILEGMIKYIATVEIDSMIEEEGMIKTIRLQGARTFYEGVSEEEKGSN